MSESGNLGLRSRIGIWDIKTDNKTRETSDINEWMEERRKGRSSRHKKNETIGIITATAWYWG